MLRRLSKYGLGIWAALVMTAGTGRAQDNKDADLRALIEQQNKQIQELKARLDAVTPAAQPAATNGADPTQPNLDEAAVKKIVADYLKDNPGAGMPPSVQTGYSPAGGFVIRSAPDPPYVQWDDDCRIPFELRFRGRIQLDYYNYRVTDDISHLTNKTVTQNANSVRQANESVLEIKRLRLIWEGTVWDPNLRYHFELDGNTRGLNAIQNNKVIQTGGSTDPDDASTSSIGGGATVDHAVRLFSAYVAYDFHGLCSEKGCGPDCPEGSVKYTPTYTLIVGKLKPFMSFEEVMGSGNEQMVEYAMTEWFFDADDDNLLMGAGTQIHAAEDRFYLQALITNGNESQFPATQMDDYPGFNLGFWYDFGGNWNQQRKKWDLYGDTWSDIDYSYNPVVRVGACTDIVPEDRRSLYGDDEQSRVYVMPGAPQGGSRLINLLNGDGAALGGHNAVDKFDYYTYETFASLHWRGFSLTNDWFFRSLNDFRTVPSGKGNIIYQDAGGNNSLFPTHGLFDYGMVLQGGYFIVPRKWEIVGRWSWINGDSGNIQGDGKFTTTTVPGVAGTVRVYQDAFHEYSEAREFAVGVNYYWKRQLFKWQTDFSVYQGGNPAGGGASAAGFIPGSDGWLLRTQIQMAF
jgi:hypothetical protein